MSLAGPVMEGGAQGAAQGAGLRRSLSYRDLVVYGLAYIAPIAPLSTLGFVWVASQGLIALAYVLGAVCMYFTAKSYAVMTETLPSAGSVYGFARHSLGAFPGFLAGWMILLDYLLIPALVYVLIAVALGTLIPSVDRSVWIVFMVIFTTAVNWFGVKVTTRANLVAVAAQILILGTFLVFAVIALSRGQGSGSLGFAPFFTSSQFKWAAVLAATSICINSFLGFDAISTLSEEVEGHDRRVVGRAIIAVLLISGAFFVLVSWILGNLLQGFAIKDVAAAAYELAGVAIGAWAGVALAWGYTAVIGLSNALPMQIGVARVVFAMGRDRQLPSVLARIHPRYQTPYVAMLVTAVLSLVVALAMRNMLDELATIVNFGALSGFLLLHISVIGYFGVQRKSKQWFAHWLAPLLGIVVVLGVFSGMSVLATIVGLSWLVIGVIYGGVLTIQKRDRLNADL
jgi:amino acid transporter